MPLQKFKVVRGKPDSTGRITTTTTESYMANSASEARAKAQKPGFKVVSVTKA